MFYRQTGQMHEFYEPVIGPPPDKFESAPGSGVTLLVLQKLGPEEPSAAASAPDKQPAAAPPPVFRVTQPVVCNVCDYEEYAGTIEKGAVVTVVFDVPEQIALMHGRMPNHKPGWELSLPVVFGLAGEKDFPCRGKVVSVAEKIDPQTHAQRWQVAADKVSAFKPGPGTGVCVRVITSAPHKAMLIPGSSWGGGPDEQYVRVVNDRNVVESRKVKIGRTYDGFSAVDEGLKAGDWILFGRDPYWQTRDIVGKEIKPEKITLPPPAWAAIREHGALSREQ
jgi:hypothetical protein